MTAESTKGSLAGGIGCLAIVGIAGFFFVKACHEDEALQSKPFNGKTAVVVEASELRQAFDDNEIDAANRFGVMKSITLTGTVSKIEGGSPASITLNTTDLISKVDALVRNEQMVALLRPGDLVELHCVGARKSLSGVVVDSCNEIKKL